MCNHVRTIFGQLYWVSNFEVKRADFNLCDTSKRMHGMNQTEAASFIISDIIPKVNYLSSHVSTCRRPIL